LILYESWAKEADLASALEEQEESVEDLDPDRPICGKLSARSKKRERTGVSMLHLVQHPELCIRKTFTSANDDNSEDGMLSLNYPLPSSLRSSPQIYGPMVL
jgi:hypothetical protein